MAEAIELTSALSPLDFIAALPVPAGEVESNVAVDQSMLMHALLREAEAVATLASATETLDEHLRCVCVNVIHGDSLRSVAFHVRDAAGVWHDTVASTGGDALPLTPRKMSGCQYVDDGKAVFYRF